MRSDQIQSDRIRRTITGSSTPAMDIMAIDGLTRAERDEANAYFAFVGGLVTAAGLERNHVSSLDV